MPPPTRYASPGRLEPQSRCGSKGTDRSFDPPPPGCRRGPGPRPGRPPRRSSSASWTAPDQAPVGRPRPPPSPHRPMFDVVWGPWYLIAFFQPFPNVGWLLKALKIERKGGRCVVGQGLDWSAPPPPEPAHGSTREFTQSIASFRPLAGGWLWFVLGRGLLPTTK